MTVKQRLSASVDADLVEAGRAAVAVLRQTRGEVTCRSGGADGRASVRERCGAGGHRATGATGRPPAEVDRLADELERLIATINQTNSSTRLPSGATLTEALARRDVLALRHGVLRQAAETAAQAQARYGRSEIRFVRLIDVAAIRARLDDLARERRELDTEIQAHNWTVDLIEQ